MNKLVEYVELMLRYACIPSTSATDAEWYSSHAFGACEFYASMYPEKEKEIVDKWNDEWKTRFDNIIRDKYM